MVGLTVMAVELGLVALLLVLLNARDRRRDRAIAAVRCVCPLSWQSAIAAQQLALGVPPGVALVVRAAARSHAARCDQRARNASSTIIERA